MLDKKNNVYLAISSISSKEIRKIGPLFVSKKKWNFFFFLITKILKFVSSLDPVSSPCWSPYWSWPTWLCRFSTPSPSTWSTPSSKSTSAISTTHRDRGARERRALLRPATEERLTRPCWARTTRSSTSRPRWAGAGAGAGCTSLGSVSSVSWLTRRTGERFTGARRHRSSSRSKPPVKVEGMICCQEN